eukprot:scaffold14900_cov103-Isochrysis_galbana.AAC.3
MAESRSLRASQTSRAVRPGSECDEVSRDPAMKGVRCRRAGVSSTVDRETDMTLARGGTFRADIWPARIVSGDLPGDAPCSRMSARFPPECRPLGDESAIALDVSRRPYMGSRPLPRVARREPQTSTDYCYF